MQRKKLSLFVVLGNKLFFRSRPLKLRVLEKQWKNDKKYWSKNFLKCNFSQSGVLVFKIFWGSMPPDPPSGTKILPCRCAASPNFCILLGTYSYFGLDPRLIGIGFWSVHITNSFVEIIHVNRKHIMQRKNVNENPSVLLKILTYVS